MTGISKSEKFALIRRVCVTLLFVFAAAGALNAQTTQTFNASGAFTVPAGVTQLCCPAFEQRRRY